MNNGHTKQRFSAQDWTPSKGPRGGHVWTNRVTGAKVDSTENPGGATKQQAVDPEAMKAKAMTYAKQAEDKWGNNAHAKLTEMAASLADDETPEGQRKLAAVKAMLEHVKPSGETGKTAQQQPSKKPPENLSEDSVTTNHVGILKDAMKRSDDRETYPRGDSRKVVESLQSLSLGELQNTVKEAGFDALAKTKKGILQEIYDNLDAGHRAWERIQAAREDEPERYADYDSPMELVRRMPREQAVAYAKGVLAMLIYRPDLRREFKIEDLAYLESLVRNEPMRYALDYEGE